MINIGCHLSSSGGFTKMAKTAISIGANTFQYFSRNPRGGSVKAIDADDVQKFKQLAKEYDFAPIIIHAPYTLNLCSAKPNIREFSFNMFSEDLARAKDVPGCYYNFHPGSHTGQGDNVAMEQIANALNKILKPEQSTIVLLETMAGKGSEVGKDFYQIKKIIDKVNLKDKIGVCFDTCHTFDAGYDVATNLDGVLSEFDSIIGLPYLKAVHLNDSKNILGSHKDRHECIGQGNMGIDAFKNIVNNKHLKNLPFILETPQPDLQGYADEIALLKQLSD